MNICQKEWNGMERYATIYKTVAHPIRLAILHCFSNSKSEKLTVKSIYEKLGIKQPIASHHLSILKRSKVLKRKQEAGKTYYCVCTDDECVNAILQTLKD